jgi:hypothetical protein
MTLLLFRVHDPDTDQVFVPVELEEAIADVEMELDGESEATFQVSVGAVAALAIGVDNTVATIMASAAMTTARFGYFTFPPEIGGKYYKYIHVCLRKF